MRIFGLRSAPVLAGVAGGLVLGLVVPAAAREASQTINGRSIIEHTIPANRLINNTVTGTQINESSLGTVPRATRALTLPKLVWHTIALANGFSNFYSQRPAAYAVDAQGVVHFRGDVTGGSGLPAFTLPAALRPNAQLSLPDRVGSSGYAGFLIVNTDGSVQFGDVADSATGTHYQQIASLDGVTYAP